MTKRYKTLQKKLQEIESSVFQFQLLSHDPDAHDNLSHHQPLLPNLDEIAQQLLFVKTLLSAEISSHPSKPHHLSHISRRLDQLDIVFRHFRDHGKDDGETNSGTFDNLEVASRCSCTESCLNDDGEGDADLVSELCEEQEVFYEPVAAVEEEEEEKETVELGRVETGTESWEEEGNWVWVYFGVLGGGVVIGAAVMWMVRFSDFFHSIEDEGFLFPT